MREATACQLFSPGHHVHSIQARLAAESELAPRDVVLLQRDGTLMDVLIDDHLEQWRVHDADEPQLHAWDLHRTAQLFDHGLVLIWGGRIYPCQDLTQWRDCN